MKPTSPESWLRRGLLLIAERRYTKRLARTAARVAGPTAASWLIAILLTELSARPLLWRGLEWSCVLPTRTGPLGKRAREWGQRRTVGPLQLKDAPYRFEAAAAAAAKLLDSHVGTLRAADVAAFWYGSAARQPGSTISYETALELSLPIVPHLMGRNGLTRVWWSWDV